MTTMPLAAYPWPLQLAVTVFIAGLAIAFWWVLVQLQSRSAGHDWETEVWSEIRKSPLAVAVYRVGVYLSLAFIVASLFDRFIG